MSKVMVRVGVGVAVLSALSFTTRLAAADDAAPEPRSRGTAFALSAGGTALSVGVVAIGASTGRRDVAVAGLLSSLVTPSAGEIYAGELPTWGMGIRIVSAGVAIAGVSEALKCPLASNSCPGVGGLLAASALGYASGIIYDLATAGTAVDHYNERLRLRVTPTVIPTASSGPAVGLGIGGSF